MLSSLSHLSPDFPTHLSADRKTVSEKNFEGTSVDESWALLTNCSTSFFHAVTHKAHAHFPLDIHAWEDTLAGIRGMRGVDKTLPGDPLEQTSLSSFLRTWLVAAFQPDSWAEHRRYEAPQEAQSIDCGRGGGVVAWGDLGLESPLFTC